MTKDKLLLIIRETLQQRKIGGDVIEAGVKVEDDFWYVPVSVPPETPRVVSYYYDLAEVETQIKKEHGEDVLFIPAGSADAA